MATMINKATLRLAAGEKGSATVMMILVVMCMFVVTILMIDIGHLVFDRIRLQTVVDSCALAAATQQSVGLNEIADLNGSAFDEYNYKARRELKSGKWYTSSHARRAYRYYQKVQTAIEGYRREANMMFAAKARMAAEQIKAINLPGAHLFSIAPAAQQSRLITRYMRVERPVRYKYGRKCYGDKCHWRTVRVNWPTDNPAFYGVHRPFRTRVLPQIGTAYGFDTLDVEWVKTTSDMTYAAYGLSQEVKPFVLGDRLFDLTYLPIASNLPEEYRRYIRKFRKKVTMPKMVAYAAAKPTGGSVGRLLPDYEPILYPLKSLRPSPNLSRSILYKMEH